MKQKILLWLAVASISTAAWAVESAEPNTMYVYQTNGAMFKASLDEQVVLKFLEDKMQVSVLQQEYHQWLINDLQVIKFGIEDEEGNIPSVIETPLSTPTNGNVRKVLENGQIIILHNGSKYNMLGMQL